MHLEYIKQPLIEQALSAVICACNLAEGPEKRLLISQLAILLQRITNPPMVAKCE